MKKHIYHSLIAFFGGLFGASVLFIIFYLIFAIVHSKSPFLLIFWGSFFHILIINSFVEEGTKFLLIKRDIGQYPYGFLLGLGFGTSEAILFGNLRRFSKGGSLLLLSILLLLESFAIL